MKTRVKIISIILCALVAALSLSACSTGAPTHDVSAPRYSIEPSVFEQKLNDFVSGREDRTMFTQAETAAAEYLQARLIDYGYFDAALDEISLTGENSENLHTQNVTAVYGGSGDGDRKNVIIGAYYDNCNSRITSVKQSVSGTGTHGVLANGTGVATLLAVAEYLQTEKPVLNFDVTIAFFGASSVYDYGAQRMYAKMTSAQQMNTVLMIELQRLGVDHVYAYCDSRETAREALFDRVARDNGLDIYKSTIRTPSITEGNALNGIPYYQWQQIGTFNAFFNGGIPTLNLVGANWETIDLSDRESEYNPDIAFTENDTLKNFTAMYPDYAEKMATAATLVIRSLTDDDFLSTMIHDKNNFPDTDIFAKRWVWCLIALGIIAVAAAAMTAVCAFLAKKYKYVPPAPRATQKMKIAVFGSEYEERDPNRILIELHEVPLRDEEIFPGIPNNGQSDAKPQTPFDEPNDTNNGDK